MTTSEPLDLDVFEPKAQFDSSMLQPAGIWAVLSLSATMLVSLLVNVPMILIPVLAVLSAGLGAIGYLDARTHLIRNKHTLVIAAGVLMTIVGVQMMFPFEFVMLHALIGAAVTFAFMFGLAFTGGFVGGGDIKFSPVAGAALTLLSPVAAFIWVTFTLIVAGIGMIVGQFFAPEKKRTAMGPYMAIALPLSIAASALITGDAGYIPELLNLR